MKSINHTINKVDALKIIICRIDILSQNKSHEKINSTIVHIDFYRSCIRIKKTGIHLEDNLMHTFFENIPKGLSDDSLVSFILENRRKIEAQMLDKFLELFLDNMSFDNNRKYILDSIPDSLFWTKSKSWIGFIHY